MSLSWLATGWSSWSCGKCKGCFYFGWSLVQMHNAQSSQITMWLLCKINTWFTALDTSNEIWICPKVTRQKTLTKNLDSMNLKCDNVSSSSISINPISWLHEFCQYDTKTEGQNWYHVRFARSVSGSRIRFGILMLRNWCWCSCWYLCVFICCSYKIWIRSSL